LLSGEEEANVEESTLSGEFELDFEFELEESVYPGPEKA